MSLPDRPPSLPVWNPPDAACVEPPAGLVETCWRPGQTPPAEYVNAWQRSVYRWLAWFEGLTDEYTAILTGLPAAIDAAAGGLAQVLIAGLADIRQYLDGELARPPSA